ncbi:hypothetical protein ACTWJ8_29060 [Streptomyces sp. SDT5-1]|uniref:hypothetical protein n=1 Tax=Streptomyces sp. SDT5-1 TaxID=3406418 RepID=UPI003FD52843
MDHGAARAEALLIGGRAGVGKTSVAWEVSALLRAAEVDHCVLEGDYLGQVHPAPADDPRRSAITERNLVSLWSNFAALGHHRLVYTNTVSVLTRSEGMFRRAMGDDVRLVRVLLTASDDTARARLTARELGSELDTELRGSHRKSRLLDDESPPDTLRVPTDARTVPDIAREVLEATGWTAADPAEKRGPTRR